MSTETGLDAKGLAAYRRENDRIRAELAEARAAIERVRADCEPRLKVPYRVGGDYEKGVWAQAKRTLAALDVSQRPEDTREETGRG